MALNRRTQECPQIPRIPTNEKLPPHSPFGFRLLQLGRAHRMTLTLLWLLGRLGGSVWASTLQKRMLSGGIGSGRLWLATYGYLVIPAALVFAVFTAPTTSDFWRNALLAAAFDAAGNLAMAAALRVTDLSIFGPLNAFRPALAWIAGWVLLHETPTGGGLAGVGILTAGAFWLLMPSGTDRAPEQLRGRLVSIGWRILGLGLSTIGAVFLKRAAQSGSPELTLGVWVAAGWLSLLGAFALTPGLRTSLWNPAASGDRGILVLHAAVFFAMQWMTLKVFQRTLLTYSFAFFQLGMVIQVLLGRWLFGEPQLARRLIACLIMSLGALLVLLAG